MSTSGKLLGALLVIASAGCAGNQGPATNYVPGNAEVEILVENQTATSLRILAMHGGGEMSLGRVGALERTRVRIPAGAGNAVRLIARPTVDLRDGRQHISEPVQLIAGQRITWELRMSPGTSGVPRMSTIRVLACAGGQC
jgi:hypothetical protein